MRVLKSKFLEIFKHGKRAIGAPALDPPLVTILARSWKIYPGSGRELSLLIQKSGFSRDQNLMYFVKKSINLTNNCGKLSHILFFFIDDDKIDNHITSDPQI